MQRAVRCILKRVCFPASPAVPSSGEPGETGGPPRAEGGSSPDRNTHPRDDNDDDDREPPDLPPDGLPPRRHFLETFDYQHGRQLGRGFREHFHDDIPPHPREVYEYNHRPPPHWDLPPPPPHHLPPLDPRMHFDSWGPPPPPHLPLPPGLPPPIPYYDLPAGLMVAVVPVSFILLYHFVT